MFLGFSLEAELGDKAESYCYRARPGDKEYPCCILAFSIMAGVFVAVFKSMLGA